MKSKLAIIISLIIAMPIQAEYMVKIPLEKSGGGTLPDGSIKIGNGTTENKTDPAVDPASCQYDYNTHYYVEEFNADNIITRIHKIYDGNEMYVPVSKGKLISDGEGWREYEICYSVPEAEQWITIGPLYEWDDSYYCPITMPNIDEIAAIDVVFEQVHDGITYYSGSDSLPTYCNTKARNVTTIRQNTKTLEIQEESYSEIIEVPTYEDGGNWTVSCNYNRQPNSSNYTSKWLVNGSSASYYHFDNVYPLPSSSTRLDETKATNGGGYWARGMFMESYNGVSHYALCYWGGW